MKIDKSEKNNDVVFWCDGQGCKTARERGGCPNPECHHTADPTHAKHFTKMGGVWFEDYRPALEDLCEASRQLKRAADELSGQQRRKLLKIWRPTIRERIRRAFKHRF